MRLGIVQWGIRKDGDFFGHLTDVLDRAPETDWLLFPELFSLELLATRPSMETKDQAKWLAEQYEAILEIFRQCGRGILGGSHFKQVQGEILNICPIVRGGEVWEQPKVKMTGWERNDWSIRGGRGLTQLPDCLGVTICYDCEFPEAGRILAERGALVQAVPAFTETQHGFQRVRWSCLARAVENQVIVAHASLVGDLGSEPVPTTFGTSAIIAPSVPPFPPSAVLAEAEPGREQIIVAELDFETLRAARQSGDVQNWNDRNPESWRA